MNVIPGPGAEQSRLLEAGDVFRSRDKDAGFGPRCSRRETRNILSVLEALTQLAIGHIVEQRHDLKIQAALAHGLAEVIEFRRAFHMAGHLAGLPILLEEHVRFHDRLFALAGNRMLAIEREGLRRRLNGQDGLEAVPREAWIGQHEETLIAVINGDYDAAIAARSLAISQLHDAILGLPESAFREPATVTYLTKPTPK